ncbi:hypothetical protein O181_065206 [Austropuccinia psidii MF-1]|uniref:Reverse transcriptase Ty1/copia-type domain-containing protein n=1 Tax=Austropuccinia psidii MF-1 TaxID=1389203 RepID=A0A9Q3I113_9BASI|nr:hypothetical protein [Austropuccinia psidii MF-1]
MEHMKFWDIIELDFCFKLVGTTWVFEIKKDHNNNIIEQKARLCAQGFTQTPGIDFDKTFAPTGRFNSLCTLIAFAANTHLNFHQINFRSAILNAPLTETVYLSTPQGLNQDQKEKFLFLNKAIYGLKQAPLAWYERLKNWLITVNFKCYTLAPCVLFCSDREATWIYVHVGDIAIFSSDFDALKS